MEMVRRRGMAMRKAGNMEDKMRETMGKSKWKGTKILIEFK
jgi:hypothetical protein